MSNLLEVKPTYEGFFNEIIASLTEGTKGQYAAALLDFEKWCIKKYDKNLDQIIPGEDEND